MNILTKDTSRILVELKKSSAGLYSVCVNGKEYSNTLTFNEEEANKLFDITVKSVNMDSDYTSEIIRVYDSSIPVVLTN